MRRLQVGLPTTPKSAAPTTHTLTTICALSLAQQCPASPRSAANDLALGEGRRKSEKHGPTRESRLPVGASRKTTWSHDQTHIIRSRPAPWRSRLRACASRETTWAHDQHRIIAGRPASRVSRLKADARETTWGHDQKTPHRQQVGSMESYTAGRRVPRSFVGPRSTKHQHKQAGSMEK